MSSSNLAERVESSRRHGFLVRHHVADPTHEPGTHSSEPHPCINQAQSFNCKPQSHYKHVFAGILLMGLLHPRVPKFQALNTVLRRETSTCSWNAVAAAALILQSPGPSRDNGLGVLIVLQARTMSGCLNRHMNLVTNGNGAETLKTEMEKSMRNSWLDCIQ
jgi:hypothetical protein